MPCHHNLDGYLVAYLGGAGLRDDLRLGEEAVALLAAARAGRAWRQVACRGEGGPGVKSSIARDGSGRSCAEADIPELFGYSR